MFSKHLISLLLREWTPARLSSMPNPSVIDAEVCIYFGLFLPKAALQRGRLSSSAALWTAARIQIRIEHQS